MDSKEDEHLEFEEAKNSYEFEELVKYCVALANEGGGWMVLGVTNKPRGGLPAVARSKIWNAPSRG